MANLLKECSAEWRRRWRARKVASLREGLVRLRARLLSLESMMGTNANNFPDWCVDRWMTTREEIAVLRWKLQRMGIEEA